MKILAFDLGKVIGTYDGKDAYVYALEEDKSLYHLSAFLDLQLTKGLNAVVFEAAFFQQGHAGVRFAEKVGVLRAACQGFDVPCYGVPVSTVKSRFAGNPKASKLEIIQKCIELGIDLPLVGKKKKVPDHNAADAVAIWTVFNSGTQEDFLKWYIEG